MRFLPLDPLIGQLAIAVAGDGTPLCPADRRQLQPSDVTCARGTGGFFFVMLSLLDPAISSEKLPVLAQQSREPASDG